MPETTEEDRLIWAWWVMKELLFSMKRELKKRGIGRKDVERLQLEIVRSQAHKPEDRSLDQAAKMAVLLSQIMDFLGM